MWGKTRSLSICISGFWFTSTRRQVVEFRFCECLCIAKSLGKSRSNPADNIWADFCFHTLFALQEINSECIREGKWQQKVLLKPEGFESPSFPQTQVLRLPQIFPFCSNPLEWKLAAPPLCSLTQPYNLSHILLLPLEFRLATELP